MKKVWDILESMSNEIKIVDFKMPLIKTVVSIKCSCGRDCNVSVEAVYKQNKRGNTHYLCKSCAGKCGWNEKNKKEAKEKSKKLWQDPNYAGVIVGKALATEIIKNDQL